MPGLRIVILIVFMALIPSLFLSAQDLKTLELKEGSKIWLEGRTNVSTYNCTVDSFELDARAMIQHGHGNKNADSIEIKPVHLAVTLFVSSIDCGNNLMNKDVYDALGYPEFKRIVYTYEKVKSVDTIGNIYNWNTFNIVGSLEIKEITNYAEFQVTAKHDGNHHFYLKGNHTIDMLKYEIQPPSRLNGLIRARKNLTVHFDIVIGAQ